MSSILRGALCAVVVGVVGVGAARASIMVDDFTQSIAPVWPQVQSVSTAVAHGEDEAGLASVLGGVRRYVVKSATIGVTGLDNITSNVFHDGTVSLFDYQSSAGANADVVLAYGDAFSNPLALTGVTGLEVTFSAYDRVAAGPLVVNVITEQKTGPSTTLVDTRSVQVITGGAQPLLIPNVGATLSHVDDVQVEFVAPAGTDFRVDTLSLVTVPEPASLGMVGVGALMLLRRRR